MNRNGFYFLKYGNKWIKWLISEAGWIKKESMMAATIKPCRRLFLDSVGEMIFTLHLQSGPGHISSELASTTVTTLRYPRCRQCYTLNCQVVPLGSCMVAQAVRAAEANFKAMWLETWPQMVDNHHESCLIPPAWLIYHLHSYLGN